MVAGGREQLEKRRPVVSPVEFETDALTQFVFVNFVAEPFVEDVLVAGENSFDSEDHGALLQFGMAEERRQIALRVGQRVVVANQNDSGAGDFVADIAWGENLLVGAISIAKIAKILAPESRIDGANFTLNAGDSVKLGDAAPRSQDAGGCHEIRRWSLVVGRSLFAEAANC